VGVARSTREDLWRHAEELRERAAAEVDLPALRRALVSLAIAGAGDDPDGFRKRAKALCDTTRRLGLDPEPLFDAASALCDEGESVAREALVMAPREPPPPNPLAGTPFGLRPR
jgi:hypothetical protein